MSRLRLQLAALLRRLAARLDPMPQHFGPVELVPLEAASDDAEGEFVDRLILQMALHRALHRYHPAPPTPQA